MTRMVAMDLLDHLVGAQQEGFRQLEAERLGDSEIDDQLELRRLLDRKLACLRAAQNLVRILARTPPACRGHDAAPPGSVFGLNPSTRLTKCRTFQRHDNVRLCGLVQIKTGLAV